MVAVLGLQAGDLLRVADAAGHDAVHQGGAEGAVPVDPGAEVRFQPPLVDVLVDALEQFLAVVVDELAGEHHHPGLAGLPAGVEHLGQLGGEAGGRAVLLPAGRVVDDAGLGGVGDDVLQRIGHGDLHHGVVVRLLIGVQAAGHAGDHPFPVHLFAVLAPAQVEGIQPLLGVHQLGQARGDGLHQAALAVPARLLVGHIEPVVHKGAQEIALAKLQDLFRGILEDVALIAGLFQNFVIQCFHGKLSLR